MRYTKLSSSILCAFIIFSGFVTDSVNAQQRKQRPNSKSSGSDRLEESPSATSIDEKLLNELQAFVDQTTETSEPLTKSLRNRLRLCSQIESITGELAYLVKRISPISTETKIEQELKSILEERKKDLDRYRFKNESEKESKLKELEADQKEERKAIEKFASESKSKINAMLKDYLTSQLQDAVASIDPVVRQSIMTNQNWDRFQHCKDDDFPHLVAKLSVVECARLSTQKGLSKRKSKAIIKFAKQLCSYQPKKNLKRPSVNFNVEYMDHLYVIEARAQTLYRTLDELKNNEEVSQKISQMLKNYKSAKSQKDRENDLRQGKRLLEWGNQGLKTLDTQIAKLQEFSPGDLAPLLGRKVKTRAESICELIRLLDDPKLAKGFDRIFSSK